MNKISSFLLYSDYMFLLNMTQNVSQFIWNLLTIPPKVEHELKKCGRRRISDISDYKYIETSISTFWRSNIHLTNEFQNNDARDSKKKLQIFFQACKIVFLMLKIHFFSVCFYSSCSVLYPFLHHVSWFSIFRIYTIFRFWRLRQHILFLYQIKMFWAYSRDCK